MTNDELTARLQSLQAQVLALQIAVRLALASAPHLATVVQQATPLVADGLLAYDMTDSQIEEASRLLRMLGSPLPGTPPAA